MNKSILSFELNDKVQIEVARNLFIYGVVSEYVRNRANKLIISDENGKHLICNLDDLEKVED